MKLDCVKAANYGLGAGWVVINTVNGGVVAHDERDGDGWAWYAAANNLAAALDDIQRTITGLSPQEFRQKP